LTSDLHRTGEPGACYKPNAPGTVPEARRPRRPHTLGWVPRSPYGSCRDTQTTAEQQVDATEAGHVTSWQGRRGRSRQYSEPLISNRSLQFSFASLAAGASGTGMEGVAGKRSHRMVASLRGASPDSLQPSVNNVLRLLRRIQAAVRDTGSYASICLSHTRSKQAMPWNAQRP
jgi:hypothetical protein